LLIPTRLVNYKNRQPHRRDAVSAKAVAITREQGQGVNIPKDNWLGFIGDVQKFTGEVTFKTSLRIDGHFSGHVNSENGTLTVSAGAKLSEAVIDVAVARINGKVEGEIKANQLVLGQTADVTADVSTQTLIVEEGALFNGRCCSA